MATDVASLQAPAALPPSRARAAALTGGDDFTRDVVGVAFLVRLLALVAGVVGLPDADVTAGVLAVILLLGITSYLGLARRGLPRVVLRHPSIAMADVLLVVLVVAVAGVDSPLVLATFSTALVVGVVFPAPVAVLLGVVLVGGFTGAWRADGLSFQDLGFSVAVGTPLLYAGLVWVGLSVRRLHARQVEVLRALAHTEGLRTAADERARLAREMHDSLAKTLHGIALAASALPVWVERDPRRAAQSARQLAQDAERAAAEARAILDRMRADQPDRPLAQVLGEHCRAFAVEHGITCDFTAEVVVDAADDVRYEAVAVVQEALRNVAAHADASRVTVALTAQGEELEVLVSDNGRGFEPQPDGDGPRGRYGLRGMRERAELAGGRLRVVSAPDAGTVVSLRLPRGGSS